MADTVTVRWRDPMFGDVHLLTVFDVEPGGPGEHETYGGRADTACGMKATGHLVAADEALSCPECIEHGKPSVLREAITVLRDAWERVPEVVAVAA